MPANRMHPGTPPSRRAGQAGEWRWHARKATEMVAQMFHQLYPSDGPAEIRGRVVGTATDALGLAEDGTFRHTMEVDLGEGPQPDEMITTAGIFRIVANHAGIDRGEAMAVETFMAEVQRELDRLGL